MQTRRGGLFSLCLLLAAVTHSSPLELGHPGPSSCSSTDGSPHAAQPDASVSSSASAAPPAGAAGTPPPSSCHTATIVTLLNDGVMDGSSMVCSMFQELATAMVQGLGELGVVGTAVCCQLHAAECWSPAANALVPFAVQGSQVRSQAAPPLFLFHLLLIYASVVAVCTPALERVVGPELLGAVRGVVLQRPSAWQVIVLGLGVLVPPFYEVPPGSTCPACDAACHGGA